MSEIAAAAERRRKHREARVAPESPYYDPNAKEPWPYSRQLDKDAAELSDAYLAEHPADDATPVTAEWLKASGMPFNTTAVGGGPSRVWNLLFDSPRGSKRVVVPVEAVPTRGDARAVCLGLGIPLTGDVR